ncbi:glycosyltransferase [Scytonema hofmannii FACHB-248]|uniref:Glycosyltransferase n=1 Tax=Scytonema hofmannii FACHB-248 TaxID=1842502 RepID=A0ABR8GK45_9CYAN|nr:MULTISPECIES: glycosyltransferase [Nostocales]MBD2603765.1 glycosyltransferase [Scytonema hofmannii FACHB-248]
MLVSILINNYNYERFLPQAIASALNQTAFPTEVVVVDDGSTDNSRAIIESYGEKIVTVFKENGGQASAFNAGFQASKGEIICFLDADDYCALNKLSRIIELFNKHKSAGWIFHTLDDVDVNGHSLEVERNQDVSELLLADFREDILRGQNLPAFPATSGLCFKRDLLSQFLPMPEQFKISADNFLRLAAIYLAPGILLPEKLAVHRIHGSNLFEFRPDAEILHADTNIKTSYYLKERFPQTENFTNKLYSHAFGKLAGKASLNKALQIPETKEYIKNFSVGSWLRCAPRIIYNYAKAVMANRERFAR